MKNTLLHWISSVAIALLVVSSGAWGLSNRADLEGTVVFLDASVNGEIQGVAPDLEVVFVKAEHPIPYWYNHENNGGILNAEAEYGLIDVAYMREQSVGDPTGDYGLINAQTEKFDEELKFGKGGFSIPYAEAMVTLLIVPHEGAQASMNTSGVGNWQIEASAEETFWAGNTNLEGIPGEARFRHGHELETGMPRLATDSEVEWRIQGDVSVYVWGANVTVSEEDKQEEIIPSGIWRTNHTARDLHPPHGLAWEQHYQFLRIELTGADLTLDHWKGPVVWAAPEISTQVEGSVTYTAQRGFLESSKYAYNVRDETIRLEGTIDQEIQAREIQGSGLDAHVRGSASVSTPPTQRISEPELEPEPESKGSVEEEPQISPSQSWISGVNVRSWFLNPWMLLLATAVVLVGTGWRYRDRAPYVSSFTLSDWAQDALDEGKIKKARRLSKKALSKDQSNQAAWVAYGMTLIQEGDYEHTVRELKPATVGPQGHGVVTYCLATAAIQEGADAEAIKWLELAIDQTPALKEIASEDPIFSRLRQDPAYRRLMSDRSRDEERAYG